MEYKDFLSSRSRSHLFTIPFLLTLFFTAMTNKQDNPKISKDFLTGKFNPKTHPDFIEIELPYANRKGMFMHKKAYECFKKMHIHAKNDGINLQIISAARNFERQKQIWENKWNGITLVNGKNLKTAVSDPVKRALIIMSYSSMPGTSRHHWGTDIDINSLSPGYFTTDRGKKEHKWLEQNAKLYGFCQPYKNNGRETGYKEEPWHWSYIPLAEKFLEIYKDSVANKDIKGFEGCETAVKIDVVKNYVLGINSECY